MRLSTISRIMEIDGGVICWGRKAEVDNSLRDLHNPSDDEKRLTSYRETHNKDQSVEGPIGTLLPKFPINAPPPLPGATCVKNYIYFLDEKCYSCYRYH